MKTVHVVTALFIATLILAASPTNAADSSDYDTSFNAPTGFLTMIKDNDQFVTDVVTDSSGNIFVAGVIETTLGSTGFRPFVAKINSSGSSDQTFGNLGISIIPSDLPSTFVTSFVDIGLASDGKIYVSFPGLGGTPSSWNFFLVRVLADGSGLDTSFGLLGLTGVAFDMVGGDNPGEDLPYDLAVQPDGSIVVVGSVERGGGTDRDFGIARFTTTGANDTTFSTDGKTLAWFDLGGGDLDIAWGVALATSGQIVVVGQAETASGFDAAVAVLTSAGAADTSFSSDGMAAYQYEDIGSGLTAVDNRAFAVTTFETIIRGRSTDTILIGGTSSEPNLIGATKEMSVLCLEMTGTQCPTFGSIGWSLVDFSDNGIFGIGDTNDEVGSIMADPLKGTVTIVGGATQITGSQFTYNAVARMDLLTGSLDPSFNGGKRYYTEIEESNNLITGDLDNLNRTIVATKTYSSTNSTDNVWVGRLGLVPETPLFSDNFESGNFSAWDDVQP